MLELAYRAGEYRPDGTVREGSRLPGAGGMDDMVLDQTVDYVQGVDLPCRSVVWRHRTLHVDDISTGLGDDGEVRLPACSENNGWPVLRSLRDSLEDLTATAGEFLQNRLVPVSGPQFRELP
ncbi:hypothetical protein ACIRYZ_45910 [Kitasatospora sp. NPDC101155]|uniref:hypothetical protein n=1 Tax=Kitasatospora sp. NPDC101155 TaxID=3364097 RepID=UPI00382DD245